METFVQLIFIIALMKYCLKAALFDSIGVLIGYAAAAAAVAVLLYPLVIEQPLTIISQILADKTMLTNVALFTIMEAIMGMFILKRTKWAFLLKIIPGILVFVAIGYFELLFFKYRAGSDFVATAVWFALLLFIGILIGSLSTKYALKEESLKLEVKVIFNMAILVLGLLLSSSVAEYNISHAQTTIEWQALIVLIMGAFLLIALGLCLQKMNLKKILKK